MKPEHRSELMRLAASRNEKGFSGVLAEAIEHYLSGEGKREEQKRILRNLYGSVSKEEGERMRQVAAELRASWR